MATSKLTNAAQSQLAAFAPKPESVPVKEEIHTQESMPAGKKLTKRDTHKVYSFWAEKSEIEEWKCYQEANPELKKAEDLGLNAIREYIENHPLTGNDKARYEDNLRRAKKQR